MERCERQGIGYRRLGKIIVATDDDEIRSLYRLLENGRSAGASGLEIIDSKQSGLNFGQQTCFINQNEFEEYILFKAKKYKIPLQQIPFSDKSESLNNHLLMTESIDSSKFGKWDGKINFSNIINKRTKIESYAKCPYQYFLNELIKIQPKNSDEETLFIDPKEKGSLQHKILEEFFKTVLSENTQPQIDEKWNQKHQDLSLIHI